MQNTLLQEVLALVSRAVQEILMHRGATASKPLVESTVLVGGPEAVLDSLGLVMLLVEVERQLEQRFRKSVVLSGGDLLDDDQRSAETIGSLATYITQRLAADVTPGL